MSATESEDLLRLSSEEMRRLGYRVVDLIIEHFESLRDKPVTRVADRPTLETRLRKPPPEKGTAIDQVLQQIEQDVLNNIMHLDHPRFFAFVPGPSNFVSVMADALATGFNVFAGSWLEASGAAAIELVTIDWLRQLCGLPETAGGLFVSGGSAANLTALVVARHITLGEQHSQAIVYCSDQSHSSIKRAMKVLGFSPGQLRVLPSDGHFRLSVADLRKEVARDRLTGGVPFCVVANAGTTNTGSVDPLAELAGYCHQEGLWLHADAAYGGAALLCDKGRALLQGLEQVDSLAFDPHKWLFQPYEMGCVLVRQGRWLQDVFHVVSDYGKDEERGEDEVNYCDYGIQLTRHFRALKLWMSLKTFGLEAFRRSIARGIGLAERAQALVAGCPHCELVTPAQLGVVTFRYVAEGRSLSEMNALNRRIVSLCIADKFAMVSSTELKGKVALRLCIINPQTTETDIHETIQRIARFGKQLSGAGA